jgi:riboflavin kinase / FMN adenylyltransferase
MKMQIIELSYPFKIKKHSLKNLALAIGYFDGVHRGHQAVLCSAKDFAEKLNLVSAVMTFDPHPREVLGKEQITGYLTPLPEKLNFFSKMGIEIIYIVKFDPIFAALSKEAFVDEILFPIGVKSVSTGFNFTFGKKASGKAEDLRRLSQNSFVTDIVAPVQVNGFIASSTRARQLLYEGRIREVSEILGRCYLIEGKVVPGEGRGRKIGFPTANLHLEYPYIIPKRGVYGVRVQLFNRVFNGIMNIGIRPTFSDLNPTTKIEVHLFGCSENLYGQRLRVELMCFIRDERKFLSIEDLRHQIKNDILFLKKRQFHF